MYSYPAPVSIIASAIGLLGAWGGLSAFMAKLAFGLEGRKVLLFVGLPAGIVIVALMWKKLPRIHGFED